MSDFQTSSRCRMAAAVIIFAGLLTACLGQDFLNAPLELDGFDHGWLVNVEPDEEFEVGLVANPLYPDVQWQLADFDPRLIEFDGSEHITTNCQPTDENPCPPGSEEEPFLAFSEFQFTGSMLGESPLSFELTVDGELVGACEYTIRVVEDACEGDIGIAANRCGLGDRDWDPDLGDRDWDVGVAVYEHGTRQTLGVGQVLAVSLPANTMHPEAPWQVAEIDPVVLAHQATAQGPARTPGDWDTSERDKPWQFLPVWRLTFKATGLGESPLMLEVVATGGRVDVFEITVNVVEDAPDRS